MSIAAEPMRFEPVTLGGTRIRLEALEPRHREAYLAAACLDPAVFRWFTHSLHGPAASEKSFTEALFAQERREKLFFATIDGASGRFVGSTAIIMIDREHRRLEVGHTWIIPEFQRSYVNTEAKFLMFRHCFETLGCLRVELKTDALNERSRAAIARVGGIPEGVFRSHMICEGDRIRDSAYFSIIAPEWARTRTKLEEMLGR
jgi:N-acetyltransferase